MNPNIALTLIILALFIMISQSGKEGMEGTAWFPQIYFKNIRQGMEHFMNFGSNTNDNNDIANNDIIEDNAKDAHCPDMIMDHVQSPNFMRLDQPNIPCNDEVDGWYFGKNNQPDVTLYDQNTTYNCQDKLNLSNLNTISPTEIFYNRAGNAKNSYKYY